MLDLVGFLEGRISLGRETGLKAGRFTVHDPQLHGEGLAKS